MAAAAQEVRLNANDPLGGEAREAPGLSDECEIKGALASIQHRRLDRKQVDGHSLVTNEKLANDDAGGDRVTIPALQNVMAQRAAGRTYSDEAIERLSPL